MDKKKRNVIIIIAISLTLIIIYGLGNQNNNIDNTNTNINETQTDDAELKSELFGDSNDKKNYYFDHEKTIRKFVLAYNEKAKTKVTKVDWKNNHQIAYIYFDKMSAKFNTSKNIGFLIEFEFANGKEMINQYKSIIKDLVLTFDSSVTDDIFNNAFGDAESNQYTPSKVTDNIFITMHYSENQVSYKSGDRYYIDIACNNYNK